MSSKKRKNLSSWSECNQCKIVINQRDCIGHKEKFCPPNLQECIHPFIFNSCLYTSLKISQLQELTIDHLPNENKNDFIFMPCEVLQLCKFPIGDPVIIMPHNETDFIPFVKLAWPIENKSVIYAVISKEVSELNSIIPETHVKVVKNDEKVQVAKTVILSCGNDEFHLAQEQWAVRLKKENLNKLIRIGNKIQLKFCGRQFICTVAQIVPFNDCEEEMCSGFYLITPESHFKLTNDSLIKKQRSKNLISKLGGLNETIEELQDVISFILEGNKHSFGLNIAHGILIHGPSGTGKSLLIQAMAQHFTDNVVVIQSNKIFSKIVGETEKELEDSFDRAIEMSPSVILIDDLDVLTTKSGSEYEKKIMGTLALLMDALNMNNIPVAVLAATSKLHNIDAMLRSSTRFGKEIEIHVPNCCQRFDIINRLLADVDHELEESHIRSIADTTHGFVGADLFSLVNKALLKNHKRTQGKEKVSENDFMWAVTKVKPSALKEIMVEVPRVKWEDIGGQDELKLKLKQSIEWPLKYGDSFEKLGITPPKGLLMFGPPGCSKTMIAKALATESSLNFISVKGPELFNKWVGESERAVRKVFRRARQAAPCIIFFDEIDAIGGERIHSAGGNVQERVLAQMLVELDGVEPLDNVTIIAATNRPDRIDPALLRPGRLDRIVYVPLPDVETRKEIIRLQLKKTCVSEDVDSDELANLTDGYSGAEIVAIFREAALKALEENFNADQVMKRHFLSALKMVIPRTPKSLLEMYEKYQQK